MKRYDAQCYNWDSSTSEGTMVESADGDYILYDEAQAEMDRWIELCKVNDEIGNTLLADVVSLKAEIDRLKADLFEAKREYIQRQEWSAKQTEVVIKGLKDEIDELVNALQWSNKALRLADKGESSNFSGTIKANDMVIAKLVKTDRSGSND